MTKLEQIVNKTSKGITLGVDGKKFYPELVFSVIRKAKLKRKNRRMLSLMWEQRNKRFYVSNHTFLVLELKTGSAPHTEQ